jgi:hypothetical protein
VIFWSPWISLTECSYSIFALVVFYMQVRNYFLLLVMSMSDVSGKSKPMKVGLRTRILRLVEGKENVLTIERNRFHKL